jgi:4-carboxymuconolactone decarboxylase
VTRPRRSRRLLPAELDADQRALYEEIVGGPRAGRPGATALVDDEGCLAGPFGTFLLQPGLGRVLQAVGAELRYATGLADRAREIAILVVAAHHDAVYERYVHEPIARSLGLTDAQLARLRDADHSTLDAGDALVADAAKEMLVGGDVPEERFAALRGQLGDAQIFELTAVVGYYALLALQLRVFAVGTPDH